MIAPINIVEISPTIAKGSLISFPEISINIGILLGYVFIRFALFVIPESPRWLVMQNWLDEAKIGVAKDHRQ
ncbi:hypothetical protein RJ641_015451 [Dillenia turbinata]|uniref:Major facilitator superfamily (MFS) profile domain-containing protein n=1 Tax=Dillenia turbinata TaxID=194707 RepID=A0AAN8Z088_9MAGN